MILWLYERGERGGVHLGLGTDSANKSLGYRPGRKKQRHAVGAGWTVMWRGRPRAFPWLAKAPATQSTLRPCGEICRTWTSVCGCSHCLWYSQHGVSQGQLAAAQLRLGHGLEATAARDHASTGLGHTSTPAWAEHGGCGWATASGNSRRAEHGPEGQSMDSDKHSAAKDQRKSRSAENVQNNEERTLKHQRDVGVKGKCGRHWQRKIPPKNGQASWVLCEDTPASTAAQKCMLSSKK